MARFQLGQRAKSAGLKRTGNPPIALSIRFQVFRNLDGIHPHTTQHHFLDLAESRVAELPPQRLGDSKQLPPLLAQQSSLLPQAGGIGT